MTSFHSGGLDKLSAAKLWLVSEQTKNLPYLSHALFALTPVASTDVETVTVDEHWRIYVNPSWLIDVDVPELGAALAHMVWHLLHDHADRARTVRATASAAGSWHQAADAALAGILRPDGLLPIGMPTPADLGLSEGKAAEEYFAILSKLRADADVQSGEAELAPLCGSGSDGIVRSHELPPDTDAASVDPEDASHIRHRVAIDYSDHVTGRGDQAGDAWRWARGILEPKIAWEPLLASAVRRAAGWTNGHAEYTYLKRSRRQSAVPNIVLPGTRRPLPNVAMVIDTSGSVDDALLGRALGEVDGALMALGVSDTCVTVLACDAAVHTVARVRHAKDARLAGGGGTDMTVGIAAASELRPRPDLIVVFTDGYTAWPSQPPSGSAVIAAMLARTGQPIPPTPSWARRIECTLD